MAKILIVDDEASFASGIADYLKLQGHSVDTANCVASARDRLAEACPDVVLLDLMLPDGSGLELLSEFRDGRPLRTIIMTGHPGVKSLIGSMAGEGISYMKKPIEPRDLTAMLNSIESGDSSNAAAGAQTSGFESLIGESEQMRAVFEQIAQVADTDSTVFVQGESGTGKELVAEAIHKRSARQGPFVPVNCGGLAKDLIASQLFGHEKGSFTGATQRHAGFFERAMDGTLFLDEITEMPLEMQTHLLRVLETGKVLRVGAEQEISTNARLVVASNRDPAKAVRDGVLREDLYFRLRVFPIVLPPLRMRKGDVPVLARYFLQELNDKHGTDKMLSPEAMSQLERHSWPGNVRELKHTIHRAYIMADGDDIRIPKYFDDDLPGDIKGLAVGRSIADVEKDLILATLEHMGGDKKAASASLGISLKTLYNRLKEYGEMPNE